MAGLTVGGLQADPQSFIDAKNRRIGGAAALNKTGVDVNSKNETDININVTGSGGAMATVESVNNKQGDANVNVSSSGFVGTLDPIN